MAMNKKEQTEMQKLRDELAEAKAFRFTEVVPCDIPIPYEAGVLHRGFLYNTYSRHVSKACTTRLSHCATDDVQPTTPGPRTLYSTRLLALKAMRYTLERQMAQDLANIDRQIEVELEKKKGVENATGRLC